MNIIKPIRHSLRSLGTIAVLAATLLAACNSQDKATTTGAHAILSYIPADSTVVMAFEVNKRVLPARLVKKYAQAFDATINFQRENLRLEFAKISQGIQDAEANEITRRIQAFAEKWADPQKVRQMGIDPENFATAIYTDQLVPVARVKLQSGHQMEAFWDDLFALVEEMRQKAGSGAYAMEKTKNGDTVQYLVKANDWRLTAFMDKEWLVMTAAPVAVYETRKARLLGLEKPQSSLADSDRLEKFYQQYGYRPGQVFWVDIVKLASYFIDPQNHPSEVVNYYARDVNVSPVCREEILTLLGHFPKVVGGLKQVSENRLENQLLWQMSQDLATSLTTLAGEIPAFLPEPDMGFGMSFNLPGSIAAASQLAQSVINQPFQCPDLRPLNMAAKQLLTATQRPLPPFVGNFKGFGISLKNLTLNLDGIDFANMDMSQASDMGSVDAAFGVAFDNVPALMGLAQLTVPSLAKLDIKPNGTPVDLSQLPELQALPIPATLKPLWLAISNDRLVLTAGIAKPEAAANLVKSPGDNKLLKAEMSAPIYQLLMQQSQAFQARLAPASQATPQDVQAELAQWRKYLEESLWWDKQATAIEFTDKGLEISITTRY